MKKRLLALLMVAMLLTGLLAGCASNSATDSGETSQTAGGVEEKKYLELAWSAAMHLLTGHKATTQMVQFQSWTHRTMHMAMMWKWLSV